MDTIIRFVNILAAFGLLFAGIYYLTNNRVRLQNEARGVSVNFHCLRDLLIASSCAAWIYAAGAY